MTSQQFINIVLLIIILVLITGIGVYASKCKMYVQGFVMTNIYRCKRTVKSNIREAMSISMKDDSFKQNTLLSVLCRN